MEWWQQLGNYAAFFSDTPALAVDMTTKGPKLDAFGYRLANGLNTTAAPLDVYPPEGMTFPDQGA